MTKSENIVPLPRRESAEAVAAEWIMRLESGCLTSAEQCAFREWRQRSDLNREAFDELAKLWGALDTIAEFKDYQPTPKEIAAPRFSRRVIVATAACVAAIIAGGGALYRVTSGLSGDYRATYETIVGQQNTIELPDGSSIQLNTDTKVEIAFSDNHRNIWLVRGEAYFNVAHNPTRPFSVYANDKAVTAVGTAFTVRIRDELVEVTVAEGRVKLATQSPDESPETRPKPLLEIKAGQNGVFGEKVEKINHVDAAMLDRKLSWRTGMLAFSGESLGDVVADVSRYTDVSIEIDDPELKAMPIAGYFKVGDINAMFDALEIMADIHIDYIDEKHVRMSRAKEG